MLRNSARARSLVGMNESSRRAAPAIATLFLAAFLMSQARAEMIRGAHQFATESHCASTRKLPASVCAIAAANAAAEFEEKAPRFPSRDACERVFRGGCSLGFRGADGYAGRRGGVYFSPRQRGFRVDVRSEQDARVTPLGAGAAFSARSALMRDASIHPRSHDYTPPVAHRAGAASQTAEFGLATPEGPKGGALPPRPPVDPNFDCAAVLEPGSDPTTGCVLAPARRR
ncbi:MAG: DUF1190 domain-containing protein [Methylocystis sp.]|nr:DUF1190 domain-containing protein [Methylocystis sp.]